ncbi:hypothetical protein V501_03973 [Pseudogymnoascus sp. VKM F-4519 (FW-2642)]|nr:hypothetical protein V501_03973 [Pseudogymnoascus sp. VKM F-4519 (FW-2642)]
MAVPRQQDAPPNPPATSTAHETPTNPSPPKDYENLVKSLIRRRDISLEVKIDLWKRFAEYEACVDEENHKNDEDEPVFTNTNATTVGEIGPDVEMPVPWMKDVPNFGSGNGDMWYHGGDGDSGYEGNGSHSVDGVENVEGDEVMDDVASAEVEENSNAAGEIVVEEIDTSVGTNSGQEKDDDVSNENGNGNRSLDATAPISEAENIAAITSNSNQETNTDVANTTQHPDPHPNLSNPPTDLPNNNQPSTAFTQVRSDIRSYFATLAERERLLASREKWLANRAEALWRNAQVLAEILGRGVDRKERKRVVREFGGDDGGEEDEEEGRGRKRTRRF